MVIPPEVWNRIVLGASRAPSAHNTQPALWRQDEEGNIYLLENTDRWLKIADPHRKDHELSLGAAFESMVIAAAQEGLSLNEPVPCSLSTISTTSGAIKYFMVTTAATGADPSPLYEALMTRTTFRGIFSPAHENVRNSLNDYLASHQEIVVIEERKKILELARMHDRSTIDFLRNPAYYEELYSWLRFNKLHKLYDKDGLNAEAMGLSKPEKIFGALAMHPLLFRLWLKIGAAGLMTSEKKQTSSASSIVLFFTKKDTSYFDTGREFLRLWLEITNLGLAMCPISTLTDHAEASKQLAADYRPNADSRLVIALRCGVASNSQGSAPTITPRLPLECLKLQEPL